MVEHEDVLHVELDEIATDGWLHALVGTLMHSNGSASYRFVARSDGYEQVSDAFPVMRLQGLDDADSGPNTWVDTARHCLEELEAQLTRDGWTRGASTGGPWWERTYTRPAQAGRAG